jgi:hypothetical protein
MVRAMLLGFRDTLRQSVAGQSEYRQYLEPMYFPGSLISQIVKNFFALQNADDVANITALHKTFILNQNVLLYSKILSVRNSIDASRRAVKTAKRKVREQRADQGIQMDESEPESERCGEDQIPPIPKAIPKKRVLAEVTNTPEAKRVRKPRQKQLSAKEIAESYGPPKTARGTRTRNKKNEENEAY